MLCEVLRNSGLCGFLNEAISLTDDVSLLLLTEPFLRGSKCSVNLLLYLFLKRIESIEGEGEFIKRKDESSSIIGDCDGEIEWIEDPIEFVVDIWSTEGNVLNLLLLGRRGGGGVDESFIACFSLLY